MFLSESAVDAEGSRIINNEELIKDWIRTVCTVHFNGLQCKGELNIGIVREASADV